MNLVHDLRFAVRQFRKVPGFCLAIVVTLALGIAANIAVFSLLDSAVLHPLPYEHAEQLVEIYEKSNAYHYVDPSLPDVVDFNVRQHSCGPIAVTSQGSANISANGQSKYVQCTFASSKFFDVIRQPCLKGRWFGERESSQNAMVVDIGVSIWRTLFRQSKDILGRSISINGTEMAIIGVFADGDVRMFQSSIVVPIVFSPDFKKVQFNREEKIFDCIARLNPGVSLRQAERELSTINQDLVKRYHESDYPGDVKVNSIVEEATNKEWRYYSLTGCVALCVLLIASANIAGLQLARGLTRQAEIDTRFALGAARSRIFLQLIVESLLLALIGALGGTLIGATALGVLERMNLIETTQSVIFWHITLFLALLIGFSAVVFGVLPAFVLSRSRFNYLNQTAATVGIQKQRLQKVFVIAQVAMACLLLIGTILLGNGLRALISEPLGFNPKNVLAIDLFLPKSTYSTKQRELFFKRLLDQLKTIHTVERVSLTAGMPFSRSTSLISCMLKMDGEPNTRPHTTVIQLATPDYFKLMQIPLLQGRYFENKGKPTSTTEVLVSQAFARSFFGNDHAIGAQFSDAGEGADRNTYQIVGVVGDIKRIFPKDRTQPYDIYVPIGNNDELSMVTVLLRTNQEPLALTSAVRKTVQSIDPTLALASVTTVEGMLAASRKLQNLTVVLIFVSSMLALILSSVGIYSLLTYFISQRTREIGIRVALGAQKFRIFQLIINRALILIGIGLLLGSVGSFFVTPLLGHFIEGTRSVDATSYLLGALVMLLLGLLAGVLPAIRASRIDPIKALRHD